MKLRLITVPNVITLLNMMCGVLAIVSVLAWGNIHLAFWLVVLAAVFDFFDGFAARLLGQYSPLGVQLDSLSDVVSFGVAPAVAMLGMWPDAPSLLGVPEWLGYSVLVVAAFSSLRLAKFNIDDTQHTEFEGLPTPANALFLMSLGYMFQHGEWIVTREVLLALTVVMSYLLVCGIRMFSFKFKGFGWRENRIRYIFAVITVVLVALFRVGGVALTIVLYVVLSTILYIVRLSREKSADAKPTK